MNFEFFEWIKFQNDVKFPFFDESIIFDNFILNNNDYRDYFKINKNYHIYEYCFGKFSEFIIEKPKLNELFSYMSYLIKMYDSSKGYYRKIIGDETIIKMIKNSIDDKRLYITEIDVKKYIYPYNKIHAHTVAHLSLTNLIVMFISNYLSEIYPDLFHFKIEIELCNIAKYNNEFYYLKNLACPMVVYKSAFVFDNGRCNTWPENTEYKCKKCFRFTETYFGNFYLCLDCYKTKYCCFCGKEASKIVCLPLCLLHLN